eukprot:TRINITY_DN113705_c0_g1_i1.p1 TRINITY_DN113705_c0_g1~~TRINITY_DN113705_c0_g1_i1.p1  ORF type:complete len:255 (+),score=37.80 TRINITY_DN113705_c0_g1_i1:92-856(+)
MGQTMGNTQCFSFLRPPPKLTTGYWDFRGLGAPMRMMCVYAKVSCEDKKFSAKQKSSGGWFAPQWDREIKPTLREHNPLVQLPYVVNHNSGEVITQSNAVYLYLGRVLGLGGRTREEELANEQVLFHLHTMWIEMRDLVYPSSHCRTEEAFKASLEKHFLTDLKAHYEKLDEWLKRKGTSFFAGSQPCTADFHVWEIIDQQEEMARRYDFPSPVEDFQLLNVFYQTFRNMPELAGYFCSDDAKLPINNKMAFFK